MNSKLVFLLLSFLFPFVINAQEKTKVIIDADTANEVDDLYALARALIEPTWDITALNAAQWQASQWAADQTMEESYRLNHAILGLMDLNIPTWRGGVNRMFDWGNQAQYSAATYNIIKEAQALSEGEKLNIIALGALTNVASAIYIAPEIASKIKLYWLGTTYDFDKDILKVNDFNCVMDVQATEILLMSDVEMVIMPTSVAVALTFSLKTTQSKIEGKHEFADFLLARWRNHFDGSISKRVIWDLALIEAIIHPEWATLKDIELTKSYKFKKLKMYESINANAMRSEFFEKLLAFLNK